MNSMTPHMSYLHFHRCNSLYKIYLRVLYLVNARLFSPFLTPYTDLFYLIGVAATTGTTPIPAPFFCAELIKFRMGHFSRWRWVGLGSTPPISLNHLPAYTLKTRAKKISLPRFPSAEIPPFPRGHTMHISASPYPPGPRESRSGRPLEETLPLPIPIEVVPRVMGARAPVTSPPRLRAPFIFEVV